MNILAITPHLQNNVTAKRNSLNSSTTVQPKFVQTLDRGTVSFTGTLMSDFVTKSVSANMSRMERIATTYLDVLESVAHKLKHLGVSFDRAYCEQNPVKSPEAYTSKIVRSGTFRVPDAIRATLYMKDPYDLSILCENLLPEMRRRGYILSNADVKAEELLKRGYMSLPDGSTDATKTFKLPDLDIRLDDMSEKAGLLPIELRYSISKPQKSGYEDLQMRFIREFDTKQNPVQHELIVLFGPNYAHSKHIESEKVYSHLRKFDEIRFDLNKNNQNTNITTANRYIDLLKQMFRGKVSEKLFLNAKNKDLYDITEEVPINFSQTDVNLFESYFKGLQNKINALYKERLKAAESSSTATKQLKSDMRHDKNLIITIKKGLNETIDYFNYQDKVKSTGN